MEGRWDWVGNNIDTSMYYSPVLSASENITCTCQCRLEKKKGWQGGGDKSIF